MKIAIIRQRYNPFGGAERFVERALSALSDEGAEVTLITRNWDGAPRKGFRQVTCNPPYSRLFGGRASRDRSFARAATQLMAAEHYDITQAHERIPGTMIFRAGDGVHAAWLDHRARQLNAWQRMAQRMAPYHRYVLAAEHALLQHPNLKTVICNSHFVADEFRTYYNVPDDKLTVIHNGVDTSTFHPKLSLTYKLATRIEHGIPLDAPLLLFVGSGFERKGVPQLLKALSLPPAQNIYLTIVGADRRLNAMRRMATQLGIAGRVRFTGPLHDVRPWYGAADGFVLPTLYDPGPNAALEALACGLPVVTSHSCGAKDWIQPEQNGFVIDALAIKALAGALSNVAELSRQPQSRSAARSSVEGLTLAAMAERLLSCYRSLPAV